MSSLRLRLLAAMLLALAAAALGMGALTYRSVLGETEALFDYQLRQMALSLRDQGAIDAGQASALADEQLDFVVQIWSVDGRAIYASRDHSALPERAALGLSDVLVAGQRWRSFAVATPSRVIQVAQPHRIRSDLAARAAWRSVQPLAWLAPPLAALVWALVGWGLRPLRRLTGELRQRDVQSLDPLPDAGLPDEVAPLVQALNALLARLGAALGAQREFVADAAHELRSPLTALKLQLQALQRTPQSEAGHEALDALAQGVARAARLVEQLLALARSEPGAAPVPHEAVDLVALAGEVIAGLWPLAQARQQGLALEGDERLVLDGDAAALHALLRNLCDNALRYTPERGQVTLSLRRAADGGALLTVDDSGPGIPEAERARVFERFVRRRTATATGGPEGSGLGLAIVRAVAERHGAQLQLGESPLGGLRVQLHFPAPGPAAAA